MSVAVDISVASRMCDLFAGRLDAYGTDAGGCEREADADRQIFLSRMLAHLEGRKPFGVYPIIDGDLVKWGCIDIDFQDEQLAWNLQAAGAGLGLNLYVERSRSKGFHAWCFAEAWVPAASMRRALLALCQIVGFDPKEVNPKRERLGGSLSNYVRIPYPEMGLHGRQVMMCKPGVPMNLEHFLSVVATTPPVALEDAAGLWVPPAKPLRNATVLQLEKIEDDQIIELAQRMKSKAAYAYRIFIEGPFEGKDRSSTMMQFVHALRDGGFTPDEALALLRVYDVQHGKFSGRRDCERRLQEIVVRSYT